MPTLKIANPKTINKTSREGSSDEYETDDNHPSDNESDVEFLRGGKLARTPESARVNGASGNGGRSGGGGNGGGNKSAVARRAGTRNSRAGKSTKSSEHDSYAGDDSDYKTDKERTSNKSASKCTKAARESPPSTPVRGHKFDQQWEARFAELKAYKSLHGDTSVPSNKSEAYGQLGKWCENQRVAYKSDKMKEERIVKLRNLGFFEASVPRSPEKAFPAYDKKWHDRIQELKQFIQTHGHANVPPRYTKNERLGKWVENVRGKYRNDKLSEEAVEELKEAGFLFSLPPPGSAYRSCTYKDNFEERVKQLLDYRNDHGNCNVPAKWNEPQGLGKWVENQKSSYRRIDAGKEKMTEEKEERFDRLKEIGLDFERRRRHGGE